MRVELKSVILLLTLYTSGLCLSVEVIVGKWCNSCVKKYTFVYISVSIDYQMFILFQTDPIATTENYKHDKNLLFYLKSNLFK